MAFWSSEKLKERIPAENLVEPYDEAAVKHCAYELAMGQQAAITTNSEVPAKDRKMVLTARQPLSIPPGQFGLLLTKEKVTVPKDAIGFISIRATKKFEGLVNVSGFHVDPGFSNHLKFSVYNAGASPIVISEADRIFMIWFADLDRPTEAFYREQRPEQNEISTQDLTRMQGEVASPAQLKKDIVELQHAFNNVKVLVGVFVTLAGSLTIGLLIRIGTYGSSATAPPSTQPVIVTPTVILQSPTTKP